MSAASMGLIVRLSGVIFSSPLNGDCTGLAQGFPELWSPPHQIHFRDSPDHIPLMHVLLACGYTPSSAEAQSGTLSQLICPILRIYMCSLVSFPRFRKYRRLSLPLP